MSVNDVLKKRAENSKRLFFLEDPVKLVGCSNTEENAQKEFASLSLTLSPLSLVHHETPFLLHAALSAHAHWHQKGPQKKLFTAQQMRPVLQITQQWLSRRIKEKELPSLSKGRLKAPLLLAKSWRCDRDPLPSSEVWTPFRWQIFIFLKSYSQARISVHSTHL